MDGVDNACDTCTAVPNPPIAGAPTANRAFVSHQRDDDADGRGNRCDFDYNNLGAVIDASDFNAVKAAVGKIVNNAFPKCAACTQGTGWSNVLGPGARVGRPVCQSAVAGACVYAP
jgi:hypothetical protein